MCLIRIFYPYYVSHNASIANLVKKLCERLDKSEFKPIAFAETETKINIPGAEIIKVPTKKISLKMISVLLHSLKDFDIIQTGPQYTHILSKIIQGLRGGFKHIHTLWGPFMEPGQASRFLYRTSDYVVGVTGFSLGRAKIEEGDKDSEVIYNGIEVDTFRTIDVEKFDQPTVLYVGNLVDFQRPLHVCRLAKAMEDVNFIVKGEGPQYKKVIRESRNLENVKVISKWLDVEELVELYNKSHIFFQPSVLEGFGLVTAESMACETPVVGANATATPEIVGDAGLIFDPDDLDGAEERVRTLLENESLRERLGKKSRDRVVERFSLEKMINNYAELYKRLSEG